MNEGSLRLFVFPEYATNHNDGLAFAIASSKEEAKELIIEKIGDCDEVARELNYAEEIDRSWGKCIVHPLTKQIAYGVTGGE